MYYLCILSCTQTAHKCQYQTYGPIAVSIYKQVDSLLILSLKHLRNLYHQQFLIPTIHRVCDAGPLQKLIKTPKTLQYNSTVIYIYTICFLKIL